MPDSRIDSHTGASTPVPARWQSGSPSTGAPGSPSSDGCVRQFDTLGYGCDTGPGTQSSATPTGKSVLDGTTTLGSPAPICRQPLTTSWASSYAPRSIWA